MTIVLSDEVTAVVPSPESFVVSVAPPAAVTVVATPTAPSTGLVLPVAGPRGSSPYEIAVKHGFTGTEQEWLATLPGARGYSPYELAVANGFAGSEAEWLASLQAPPGFYATYGFATPSTEWPIQHDQNTYALVVETYDHNGDVVEGDVQYLDDNTIRVSWFYPMTGTARVFN